jgi:hypothetical protein
MALPTEQQINYYNRIVPNTALTPISAQDKFVTASMANTASANIYLASATKAESNATVTQINAEKTAADVVASAASAALAKQQADIVTAAYNDATLYTDASLLTKGIYQTTTAGIIATPYAGYFSVPSTNTNEFLILYQVKGTSSLSQSTIPAPALLLPPNNIFSDITTEVDGYNTTRVVTTNGGAVSTYTYRKSSTPTEIKRYPSTAAITTAIESIVTEYSVANTYYISANGNDSDSGTSWKHALRTIENALSKAWTVANAAISAGKQPPIQLIEWAPESPVFTKGHLDMPDNCVVKAVHRTVFVRPVPGYEERNVFRMGSGCFLEGVMFEGWRLDSLDNPTEGFAVSFRPGAVITRVPYAHKIAVRAIPTWTKIAPPLDPQNGNPLVPRAGGVCLADGLVCSQYSIFPNIMTWGATPVLPNGIGYCAKNGGLINAVNAVSIWAHKHFLALNGGQIILSACSTQFGDYSLVADGGRNILNPQKAYLNTTNLNKPPKITSAIDVAAINSLIDTPTVNTITTGMLNSLIYAGYTGNWDYDLDTLQTKTKSDAALLLQCLYWTLESTYLQPNPSEQPMLDFAKGMFDTLTKPVYIPVAKSIVPLADGSGDLYRPLVALIKANQQIIINKVWSDLVARGYVTTWSDTDETLTRRDTGTLITAVCATLTYSNEQHMAEFVKGLYTSAGELVVSYQKLPATLYAFNSVRNSIIALIPSLAQGYRDADIPLINGLFDALISNFSFKKNLTLTNTGGSVPTLLLPANRQAVIDGVWGDLVAAGYTSQLSDATDQTLTKRDTGTLFDAVAQAIKEGNEQAVLRFAYGLYSFFGTSVISDAKMPATIQAFELIKQSIISLQSSVVDNQTKSIVSTLIENLKSNAVTIKVNPANYYIKTSTASYITSNKSTLIDTMWTNLKNNTAYYNANAIIASDEFYTRRDAGLFLDALASCLTTGTDAELIKYGNSFFISFDISVIAPNKMPGTLYCYGLLRDAINSNVTDTPSKTYITTLVSNLISNMSTSKGAVPSLSDSAKANLIRSANNIKAQQQTIINNMWNSLKSNPAYYNSSALTAADETLTRRDAATLLTALYNTLANADERYMLNFTSGLYEPARVPVIPDSKIPATIYSFYALKRRVCASPTPAYSVTDITNLIDNLISNTLLNSNKFAFLHCWDYIKNYLTTSINSTQTFKDAVAIYLGKLNQNVLNPELINEPSRITAIGHTWTAVLGGVALTKVPPANNNSTIQDSIIEGNNGIVIASGQDDQGNALFVGGLQISADTGELGGPPFDQAVRRVATKTAISRSF